VTLIYTARTETYPMAASRCERCNGKRHLVEGDGPTVCLECIDLLGGIAADPMNGSRTLREAMVELHGDIVRLGESDGGVQAWEWVGWT
jgi:hypothetical protein